MKIAVGSDHAGFHLKTAILPLLLQLGHDYFDFGCYSEESVDYPDYAQLVGQAVSKGEFDRGILFCGTGVGMTIAANKIKGIRAAMCHDTFTAHQSREHLDANILCLGERVIGTGLAMDIVKTYLTAERDPADRHTRRINKLMKFEEE